MPVVAGACAQQRNQKEQPRRKRVNKLPGEEVFDRGGVNFRAGIFGGEGRGFEIVCTGGGSAEDDDFVFEEFGRNAETGGFFRAVELRGEHAVSPDVGECGLFGREKMRAVVVEEEIVVGRLKTDGTQGRDGQAGFAADDRPVFTIDFVISDVDRAERGMWNWRGKIFPHTIIPYP